MRLRSVQTPNFHLYIPKLLEAQEGNTLSSDRRQPVLIFFLTGNPGLISYYHYFLTRLSQPGSHASTNTEMEPRSSAHCVVAGMSLGGFDVQPTSTTSLSEDDTLMIESLSYPSPADKKALYSLQDQIELCYNRLNHLSSQLIHSFTHTSKQQTNVILIGHSVGTYIALELVRLSQGRAQQSKFSVCSTILLTPTILELRNSPSGKIAAPLLGNVPFLPGLLQLCASGIAFLPRAWLKVLVGRVTGMNSASGLESTVEFLATPGCVRQALYMAKNELVEIAEDKWDQEVWETVEGEGNALRHYMWFARDDHWVAESTRDRIVEARKSTQTVLVSDDKLVHAWCLDQSEMVAKQVMGWIEEILARRDQTTFQSV